MDQGYYDLSIIKKKGWRVLNKWETLVPFGWLVQRLLVIVGSLPWWRSKHDATLYMVGRCMLASMKRRSSCDNFSCSPFFFISPPPRKV